MWARRCWCSCADDSGGTAPWCRQEAARLDPPVEGLGELSEANSVTGVQVFAVLVQEALDDGTLFLEVCVWVHGVLGVWGWIAAPTDVERQPAHGWQWQVVDFRCAHKAVDGAVRTPRDPRSENLGWRANSQEAGCALESHANMRLGTNGGEVTEEVKKSSDGLVLKVALGVVLGGIVLAGGTCAAIGAFGAYAAHSAQNFEKLQCRTKASEARGNLKALYVAEEANRAELDSYSADLNKIGFFPKGETLRYVYVLTEATKDRFTAEARGFGEMAGDAWRMNNKGELVNVMQLCKD